MKKVLILTTSTGYGHNLAAYSTKDIINDSTKEVIIYDFLQSNKLINKSIVNGYELCANSLGMLYGHLYKISNISIINNLINFFLFKVRRKLLNYIKDYEPDIIIATHPLSICLLSSLKKQRFIDIPLISIVTDFKAHYTYISKEIDAYITASTFTKNDLIKKGIDKSRIYPIGIPIRKDFYKTNEIAITHTNTNLNILLMGGGMGLKNISLVLEQIISNNNINITVICGKNIALKDSLTNTYKNYINNKLSIIGYTTEVSNIMQNSDLLITKPGGLTSTEAIVTNLPMLIPFIIPGQESENKDFLVKNNCAISVNKLDQINKMLNILLKNPSKLIEMQCNMRNISSSYCQENLITLCNMLIDSKR